MRLIMIPAQTMGRPTLLPGYMTGISQTLMQLGSRTPADLVIGTRDWIRDRCNHAVARDEKGKPFFFVWTPDKRWRPCGRMQPTSGNIVAVQYD